MKASVMKKDGTSYIECQCGLTTDNMLVNGTPPAVCPGNNRWCMVEGDIERIERILPETREHAGFNLKSEFVGVVAATVPSTMPLGAFEYDYDGGWIGERAELYEPAYKTKPSTTEPVEFEVIDFDCEPVAMPSYVEVEFPANLRFRREVQHKYPCRVRMQDVFPLVADAVVKETQKHPGLYELHDCRNIQSLSVKVRIDKKQVTVRKRDWFSKRPKWSTVTETHTTKEVLSIVGKYDDKGRSTQICEVSGKDYADLAAKLEAYIQGFVSLIDPRRWCVCETCGGEGVVLKG